MIIPFSKNLKETRFLNRATPVCIAALIVSIISYCFIDIPLAVYFKNISASLASIARLGTNLINPTPEAMIWPVLYFFSFFVWKRKDLANRFLVLAISISLANAIVEILKPIFGRARPELLWEQNRFGFEFFAFNNAEFSFPSGHSCTAGALMGALACFYPKYSYLFLGIAFLLGFSRVVLNYHYVSDVIVGVTIGLLTAQWVYRKMKIR